MNYYKRHLGDYAKGAGHLSLVEHGAYTVLLDRYYITEQAIPETDAYRVTRARSADERAAVDAVLKEFFVLRDGAWHHGRCDEELSKYRDKSETNRAVAVSREAAKRAANVARSDHERTTNRAQNVVESCVSGEPSHKPVTSNQEEKQKQQGGPPDGDPPPSSPEFIPFERIREAYNATLTRLAKCREITPKRRTLVRSAWHASTERRSLGFWQAYFEECEADPFLNGTGPYGNGHENWRPTFDYLLRSDVVTRVFEKAMDRMERAA